ncbi:hypothetical protein FOE78_22790 [Microlunatus elymi]|uniref:Uncharacterized protein n=1 Tax=Microlunatus elymi TaxID=2596828 RepID=A0A516Q4I2_9ACTN|nr:hypothetical protein [Microlunatus elymi]QDP98353.1 hypothetical protein FOE78_22790 [Microlunatus elymi]
MGRFYLVMALLLLVQFVLGMVTNLFVTIPKVHPGSDGTANYFSRSVSSVGWAVSHGNGWLVLHAGLGMVLILGGLVTLVPALSRHDGATLATAIVGVVAIIGVAFNGASFLDFNYDASSMIMAGLFAVALGSYVVGLDVTGTRAVRATQHATVS